MKTDYEWSVNFMSDYKNDDGSRDIIDMVHVSKLSDIPDEEWDRIDCDHIELELAKKVGNDERGLVARWYACTYIHHGEIVLDEVFDDHSKVPKRYLVELEKMKAKEKRERRKYESKECKPDF